VGSSRCSLTPPRAFHLEITIEAVDHHVRERADEATRQAFWAAVYVWHVLTHNVRYYQILSEIFKLTVHRKSWCKKNTITCGQVVDAMAATRMRYKGTGNGTFYIDLAEGLSLQTRKLRRQKMIYTVYGGYYVDRQGSRIDINVAPNTWPVKRSINRAFAMWRKMIARTLANADGLTTGKYNDFHIFLDNQMGTAGLRPVDASGNDLFDNTPEWEYSTLTTDDPTTSEDTTSSNHSGPGTALEIMEPDQFELQIVGPHVGTSGNWTRISTLQSWVDSRAMPFSDDPSIDFHASHADPLSNLFDAGDTDDDKIQVITTEGDSAPYDEDSMFGNAYGSGNSNNLQRVSTAITTAANAIMPIHGFEAVCGLVQINIPTYAGNPGEWELVLDVEVNGVKF
jgi:hypothetical protein